MTLEELGVEYDRSAALLRARLKDLRAALKAEEDVAERWRINRRILDLTPMLTQCNKISKFCRRYYEPGFYIADGPLDTREKRIKPGKAKQIPTTGAALHYEKRTNPEAIVYCE